jgi:hypothetical protein
MGKAVLPSSFSGRGPPEGPPSERSVLKPTPSRLTRASDHGTMCWEEDLTRAAQMKLSSIELALLAELNLQMAHAYDEAAEDAHNSVEARQDARARGSRLRERARRFQEEARRSSDEAALTTAGAVYTGPERRRGDRRTSERRARRSTGSSPGRS